MSNDTDPSASLRSSPNCTRGVTEASGESRIAPFPTPTACGQCNRDTSGEMTWPGENGTEVCQDCWEAECSRSWWEQVNAINAIYHQKQSESGNAPISCQPQHNRANDNMP